MVLNPAQIATDPAENRPFFTAARANPTRRHNASLPRLNDRSIVIGIIGSGKQAPCQPSWWCPALGQRTGLVGLGFLLQMAEYLLDDHRVFNAGDDLDGATAFNAGLDIDVASGRLLLVNTRLRRCAQVIAACRSTGVRASASSCARRLLPLPRFAGVTRARCLLFGAKTP